MNRKEILKQFLQSIFGKTTVKPIDKSNTIYLGGDLYSKCEFNMSDLKQYEKLINIAFIRANTIVRNKNATGNDVPFDRKISVHNFFKYLETLNMYITFPESEYEQIYDYAYNWAIMILNAIFNSNSDDDVMSVLENTLDEIAKDSNRISINRIIELSSLSKPIEFQDKEFNASRTNIEFPIMLDNTQFILPVDLPIYINNDLEYNPETNFFYQNIHYQLSGYNSHIESCNFAKTLTTEYYLTSPISDVKIKFPPTEFNFKTCIDEEILMQYNCINAEVIKNEISNKAREQFSDTYNTKLTEYETSLVDYTESIIKRVQAVDLEWLYGGNEKTVERCETEICKILYSKEFLFKICKCDNAVRVEQMTTVLHHAIVSVTEFLNKHGSVIAEYAKKHNCDNHKNAVKELLFSGSLYILAKKLKTIEDVKPQTLRELYYFTSNKELQELLNAVDDYINAVKN